MSCKHILPVLALTLFQAFGTPLDEPVSEPEFQHEDISPPSSRGNRTPPAEDTPIDEEKKALINRLGAESVDDRDKAEQEIWKRGKEFLPFLQQAASSEDPEISERASRIIPKIILSLKPDKSSVLGEFADKYAVANADDRSEMMGEFLERDELTASEAKAALRMQVSMATAPEEVHLNDWQLQKLGGLLQKESSELIFKGKTDTAVELWNDIDFSPQIRHKYVSMLFNAGKPFDKSQFLQEESRLAEAELALLAGDTEKARLLIPEGDTYLTQRIIAADFNLEEKWKTALESLSPEGTTTQEKNLLPVLWASARSKGDKETQQKAITLISQVTPREEPQTLDDINFEDGYPESSPVPYGKLEAASLLLACGEADQASRLITDSLPDATPDKTMSMGYSIVRFPGFDPKLLGAKDSTPEALTELAASICPLIPLPEPSGQPAPLSKENKMPSQADLITMMRLLTVGNYMDARGEGHRITPYILSHLQKVSDASRNILSQYYTIALNAFEARLLAYDVFRECVKRGLIPEQSQEVCELNIAYGNFRSRNTRKQWDSLYPLAAALVGNPKDRLERLDALYLLLGLLPDPEEKQKDLLAKVKKHLREHSNDEGIDLTAQTLTALLIKNGQDTLDILSISEALGRPVLLNKNDFAPESDQLISFLLKSGSEQQKEAYRKALEEKMKAFPSPEQEEEDGDLAQWGEYLSLLQEEINPALAEQIRKKARLYSTSETESRVRNALCSSQTKSAEQILKRAFPCYVVDADDAKNDTYTMPQYRANQGIYLIFPCQQEGLYKQAWYFVESTLDEITSSPVFNIISPGNILILRGLAELNRGLIEYKDGQREKAMESFQMAHHLLRGIQRFYFYTALLQAYPELKGACLQWYKEDLDQMEFNRKHWPNASDWRDELIFSGLILGQNAAELDEIYSTYPEKAKVEPYYQACVEYHKGNKEKALQLLTGQEKKDIYTTPIFLNLFRSAYDPNAPAPDINEPAKEEPQPETPQTPPVSASAENAAIKN